MIARTQGRRKAPGDAGSALVEFVVVLPALLLVLVGLMEVGRFADYTIKVGNAARAGAAYGAQAWETANDAGGIESAAMHDAGNLSGVTVTARPPFCQCSDAGASPNCLGTDCPATSSYPGNHRIVFVEVDAAGTLPSILNYPGLPAALRTITVNAKSVMPVAQ